MAIGTGLACATPAPIPGEDALTPRRSCGPFTRSKKALPEIRFGPGEIEEIEEMGRVPVGNRAAQVPTAIHFYPTPLGPHLEATRSLGSSFGIGRSSDYLNAGLSRPTNVKPAAPELSVGNMRIEQTTHRSSVESAMGAR